MALAQIGLCMNIVLMRQNAKLLQACRYIHQLSYFIFTFSFGFVYLHSWLLDAYVYGSLMNMGKRNFRMHMLFAVC